MENKFEKWYSCDIERETLLKFMERSNSKGLIRISLHLTVLIALGYLSFRLIGTYWMYPSFFAYGTVYCFLNHVMHETHHRTPFKSNALNESVHWITAFAHGAEPIFDRWGHAQHHTYTYFPDVDPEVPNPRPIKISVILGQFFGIGIIKPIPIIKHALGIIDSYTENLVPESDWKKMIWSSRLWVLGYAAIIFSSIYFQTFLPLVFTLFARFYGAFIPTMLNHTQHVGLEENVYDHRLCTRNVKVNPILSFFYWNMEYHIEHHIYPGVPFHALSKLNNEVKDQLPRPYKSVWAAYKELIPTIIKQQKESDYHVTPVLPQLKSSKTDENSGEREIRIFEDAEGFWVSSIKAEELKSNGVLPFKYESKEYAVYRIGGNFFASDARCTHAGALLSKGMVIGESIECPAHQGRFNIKSGEATHSPACDRLKIYNTRIIDSIVYICFPGKDN
ncbi:MULTISPECIES: fatty acid desaturase [unclassified Oceanispirochaeta]|uniref:fatty acid desaturase n=1 Tax=unclassified Oceanispirochaeta TaxID=2635722 RepID=UPI001314D992|nr:MULTISPECIES: fatty acid desaturase [unclassified Oceanispirochaeta]MBF9016825.1 fatty acid desaturase [Oceanispirochaeta sp. M2]NPD73188.1 Rieske 2Fe-2S domain-containing protein [Oceanispirochaeta sp. M1]